MAGNLIEFIFRGDNRSMIRSLNEIARGSDKTARQIERDSRTSQQGFERMGSSAKRMREQVGGLLGVAGIGGLAFGLKNVIQAGESWQQQQAQLQGALKNTGIYSKRTLESLSSYSENLATRGGFG